jgi:hypothetical protein
VFPGQKGDIQTWDVMNKAAINMRVQFFLSEVDLQSFRYMSKRGIGGSSGTSVCLLQPHLNPLQMN